MAQRRPISLTTKPRVVYLLEPRRGVVLFEKDKTEDRRLELRERSPHKYPQPKASLCRGREDCFASSGGKWQKGNFVTCNLVHEIDLIHNEKATFVAKGGKRLVWKVPHHYGSNNTNLNQTVPQENSEEEGETVALKMFKYRRDRKDDFGPMTLDWQRRDALIHQVTSSSPYIVNVHGFCGASALYDFADGGDIEANVVKNGPLQGVELLHTAYRIASSVADVHHVDKSGVPTIAHADIYGPQWVKVHGDYMLTDFNLAKFLVKTKSTNQVLPFRRDVVDNWFAPEAHKQQNITEDIVTEKLDIWNMGNVLYMILVGRLPFDGRPRQEVHELIITRKQIRPEIPLENRNSHDYINRVLVQAIDVCQQEEPQERPTARQVARVFGDAIKSLSSYTSLQELNDRSGRFPSMEERVKRYMSSWYAPPCDIDPTSFVQYQKLPSSSVASNVLVRALAKKDHIAEIGSVIRTDDVMIIDPGLLEQEGLPHAGYRADILNTVVPFYDSLKGKPLFTQWGDKTSFVISTFDQENATLTIPHLKKCRPVLTRSELEQMTAASCYGAEPRLQGRKEAHPIIWKLDSNRLLGGVPLVAKNDRPWSDKQAKGVFRGRLTGHAMYPNRTVVVREHVSEEEYCNCIERCRFVLKHHNSSTVDVRLVDLMNKPLRPSVGGVPLLGNKMPMKDFLDYRVLILLEGNDVPSGLAWSLRSKSVVMMPPPTSCSWLMEELLQPWVHYIPLDPSFDDLEDKMQWFLAHDEEAEQIARRGSLWIQDLLEHPDANADNGKIFRRMLERYEKLLVSSDKLLARYTTPLPSED